MTILLHELLRTLDPPRSRKTIPYPAAYWWHIPALLTPSLIEEARTALPGNWLAPCMAQVSAHWPIANEPALIEADNTLRALFLLAYHKLSEPADTNPETRPSLRGLYVIANSLDPKATLSWRRSTDDRYGEGFFAASRAASKVLIDRTPTSDATELLLGFSQFVRFDVSGLTSQRGSAARVLENIWEEMNVGWAN